MKLKFKLSCGLIIIIIGCLLHIAVYAESEDMITNTLEIINYDLKTKTETKESYVSRQKTNDISDPDIKPKIAKPFWIVGDDDRKPLLTLSEFPYSTVCFIYCLYPDGSESYGTGTVIASKYLLTAAHVIYNEEFGSAQWEHWPVRIEISPAMTRN